MEYIKMFIIYEIKYNIKLKKIFMQSNDVFKIIKLNLFYQINLLL